MSKNKRKTLMIKRPSPNESDKPGSLPKVNVSESAAGATETDKIKPVKPKTAKVKSAEPDTKGATARIALPDEAKIRKARRADDTDDKLPGAPEVMDASKNATRQIELDTEEVSHSGTSPQLEETDDWGNNDQTMQINAEALETGRQEPVSKVKVDDHSKMTEQATRVPTGKISKIKDEDIHKAPSSKKQLKDADAELNENNDQTMQIDADALQTGPIQKQLEDADNELKGNNDQTMQIDADALQTGPIEKQLEEVEADLSGNNDQTMRISADDLKEEDHTEKALKDAEKPDIHSQETMRMESLEEEDSVPSGADFNAATAELDQPEAPDETQKENDTFNAMTMAMDPSELARELEKEKTQPTPVSDEERNQTMDLSDVKPKTILIKRPSQNEAPSAPTVKTVRPDAQTVRTSRPVPGQVPAGAGSQGKTVKLRRPAGAGPRPGAMVSRYADGAGLEFKEDGALAAKAKVKAPSLGPAWLTLSVMTLLIMCGALWIALAINMPEVPMPGRIVNEFNEILPLST